MIPQYKSKLNITNSDQNNQSRSILFSNKSKAEFTNNYASRSMLTCQKSSNKLENNMSKSYLITMKSKADINSNIASRSLLPH